MTALELELTERLKKALETIELLAEEANYCSPRWRTEHVIPILKTLEKVKHLASKEPKLA